MNILAKLIHLLIKNFLIITFVITVLSCVSYFINLQGHNPKWIDEYIRVVYLLGILSIYFLIFSILSLFMQKFKLRFKKLLTHSSILLFPLVTSFDVMLSYAFSLTLFNFGSIFVSRMSFFHYSIILLAILVAPSIMFSQTWYAVRLMQNMIKPAAIDNQY